MEFIPLTPAEIVASSLKEFKMLQSRARREQVRKYLNYYTGTSTTQYIDDYFGESFSEIPPYEANFTKKFINKVSRIYTIGAQRNVNGKYDELTEGKDVMMKHLERMTRLVGSIAVRVMFNPELERFEYRPVYYFDPYFGNDPFNPQAIVYPMNLPVNDPEDTRKIQFAFFDNNNFKIYDAEGAVLHSEPHNYGTLPFVFLHRENQIDSFYVEGSSDIVNANEHVNITMTEMQLGLRFQMFGQPWTNLESDKPVSRTGSDEILMLGDGGSYNIATPGGDIQSVIDNVKFQIEMVAQNHHLWVTWAETGGEVPSGISLMIKDLERHEDFVDDIELWRVYEKNLYQVEKAIAEYNSIKLPDKFAVDFGEVEYPMTVQDQIMRDEFDLAHNLTTEAKLMVRDNKDLSLKEAQKAIDDNRGVNEQGNQQGLFNQLRQGA